MLEVVRELGRGGMGVVHEARDPALPGRRLALKVIRRELADAEAARRFQREAEALARVRHPGVVGVHSFEATAAGELRLVTDLVEGRDLAAHVAAAGRLGHRQVATLARDLADALAAIHAAGVLHRDLKPSNVLVRPDGSPVIIDFGLARKEGDERLTQTGVVVGTPGFMPPEQVDQASSADARADVYGLGAVLYWLLTGRPPFSGPPIQVVYAALHKEPAWPREVDPDAPAGLDAICRRAMAKEPHARFPSALAMRDALDAWLERGDERAPRRRRTALIGAAVALAIGAGLALAPLDPSREADPDDGVAAPRSEVAPTPATSETRATRPGEAPTPLPTSVAVPSRGGPSGRVWVRFLPDGRLVARCSDSRAFTVVEGVGAKVEQRTLTLPTPGGRGLAAWGEGALFPTDDGLFAWDGRDGLTRLWSGVADGEPAEHKGPIETDATRGEVALLGWGWPVVLRRDGAALGEARRLRDRGGGVVGLGFAGGVPVTVQGDPDRGDRMSVAIHWVTTHQQGASLDHRASRAQGADVGDERVAVACDDGVLIYDLGQRDRAPLLVRTPPETEVIAGLTGGRPALACALRGDALVAATSGKRVWRWRVADEGALRRLEEGAFGEPEDLGLRLKELPVSLDVSPDRAFVAVGTADARAHVGRMRVP